MIGITELQKKYVQKSRLFLYPMLGIKRGVSVTPIQTYMCWEGEYALSDYKLICNYHIRDDEEFKNFERSIILNNSYFQDWFELENGTAACVFDMSSIKKAFLKIVHGRYSELDVSYRSHILKFFQSQRGTYSTIMSYLEPEMFYQDYAKLLNVDIKLLEEVGELCSIPNLELENLNIKKKVVHLSIENDLLTNTIKNDKK